MSRKNSLIHNVREGLEELEIHKSTRAIERFVDELSNWYLRRSRRRFWEGSKEEKESAYNTLYETLFTLTKVMAPFTPFLSERFYQKLFQEVENGPESVHMLDYPVLNEKKVEKELEEHMDTVIKVAELGRNARQKEDIKLRQPLDEAVVVKNEDGQEEAVELFQDILKDELNVKRFRVIENEGELLHTRAEPNYSSLGPKFKGEAEKVAELIEESDGEDLKAQFEESGTARVNGYELDEEDVELVKEVKEGYTSSEGKDIKVFMNTTIDEELRTEGLARDVVRRIQTMRKELELGYTQNIDTYYEGNKELENAIQQMSDYIQKETLSSSIQKGGPSSLSGKEYLEKEWSIESKEITFIVDPIPLEQ